MKASPNFEGELRSTAADAYGPAMGAEDVPLLLQHREVLSDRDFRNREAFAQLDDRGSGLFLDHAGNGLSPLRRVLPAFDCFRLHSIGATLAPNESQVKPPLALLPLDSR